MQSDFLLILDSEDTTYQTSVVHASELVGDIINIKTTGKMIRKMYSTNLEKCSKVYTYNFKTNQVELDEIVSIEYIEGISNMYQVASYKTSPINVSSKDKVAVVDKGMRYKVSFENVNKLMQNKKISLLQIEKYSCKSNPDEIAISIGDESSILNYDMGMIIGSWCCGGDIRRDQVTVSWKFKDAAYAEAIASALITAFPNRADDVNVNSNKWGDAFVTFQFAEFADWLNEHHGESTDRSLPETYYSASEEFIDGFLFGAMLSNGRHTYNNNKKILYYTISSISKTCITQISELMSLYKGIPSAISSFVVPKTDVTLHILNIRVTDDAMESLPIEYFIDNVKEDHVPKSSKVYLNSSDDILIINNNRVDQLHDQDGSYLIYLKNNNNIIGLNGVVHYAKKSVT